jgi:hypothetical protein
MRSKRACEWNHPINENPISSIHTAEYVRSWKSSFHAKGPPSRLSEAYLMQVRKFAVVYHLPCTTMHNPPNRVDMCRLARAEQLSMCLG